jgi:hypothetical protein
MDVGKIMVTRLGGQPYTADEVVGKTRSMVLGRWLRGQTVPGFQFWAAQPGGGPRVLRGPDEAGVDPDVVDFYWHKNGAPKRQ